MILLRSFAGCSSSLIGDDFNNSTLWYHSCILGKDFQCMLQCPLFVRQFKTLILKGLFEKSLSHINGRLYFLLNILLCLLHV